MSSTANTRCFIEDGKSGFYAKGVGPLLCSSDTCGPYGRAEFGCEKCCAWPYSTPASKYIEDTCNHVPLRQSDHVKPDNLL